MSLVLSNANKTDGSLKISHTDNGKVFAQDNSWSRLFQYNDKIKLIDLHGFDTCNVTDMSWMFYGCASLSSLDLSNFNTSNVTDMSRMFSGCTGLTNLDLSGWNTSKVTTMSQMFNGCTGLTNLDLSGLDTSNVTYMDKMFAGCESLSSLDLSEWDTSALSSSAEMFKVESQIPLLVITDNDFFKNYNYESDNRTLFTTTLKVDGEKVKFIVDDNEENASYDSNETEKYINIYTNYTTTDTQEEILQTVAARLESEKNNLSVLPRYKILEWKSENETEGKVSDSLQNVYTIQWEPVKYNVEFNSNGGSGTMTNQEFTFDQEQALTENIFTREGYTFNGWNTESDGSGTSYEDKEQVTNLSDTADATITLYAQWEKNKTENDENEDENKDNGENKDNNAHQNADEKNNQDKNQKQYKNAEVNYSWSTVENSGGGSSGNSSSSPNQDLIFENQMTNNETSRQTELKIPEKLRTRKYLIGYDDGKIKPENHVTHAEFATIIYRLMNDGEEVNLNNLERIEDVKGTDWFGKAVAYLIDDSRKIINITEKKFRPQENIKGYEMMNIIHSVLQFYGVEQNSLYAQNLNSDITRAKMAEIIFNLLGRKSNQSQKIYSDLDKNHLEYKFLMDAAE